MAIMANIESREWRQQYLMKNNIPMEHPRASTTDDVECFFSVLRDTVGKDFTLKEVKFCITLLFLNVVFQVLFGWRKVTYEFVKRMDPDLPFYYHTSTHNRFYEGEMPDFNTKPKKTPQSRRTPRYELLGADNRVTFAVRNSGSIRAMFHNAPVELPPPPGTYNQLHHEHTYAASR